MLGSMTMSCSASFLSEKGIQFWLSYQDTVNMCAFQRCKWSLYIIAVYVQIKLKPTQQDISVQPFPCISSALLRGF